MTEQIRVKRSVKISEKMSDKDPDRPHVILVDHSYIQNAIFHHKTPLQTVLSFIVLLVGAERALFTQLAGRAFGAEYTNTLLLLPIPLTLLAIYHSAYTIRIQKLAACLDDDVRGRIEKIAGPELVRERPFQGKPQIIEVPRENIDGRMTYSAMLGLKVMPHVVPLTMCLSFGGRKLAWFQVSWLVVDAFLGVISGLASMIYNNMCAFTYPRGQARMSLRGAATTRRRGRRRIESVNAFVPILC